MVEPDAARVFAGRVFTSENQHGTPDGAGHTPGVEAAGLLTGVVQADVHCPCGLTRRSVYEKVEGQPLSLMGKANRLATMIRGNLGAAMQGLAVVPLFAGYDEDAGIGRIFSYDVTGGPTEERQFYAIGSGSVFARGSLKKLYAENMPVRDAVLACVQALYDAADDDSATGGPDLTRRIFPVAATVTGDGFAWVPDGESEGYARMVVEERLRSPDGPKASLRAARQLPGETRSTGQAATAARFRAVPEAHHPR